jgi:GlpG protein
MRCIGTIANEEQAQRLADHLLTLEITAKVVSSGEGWQVWVHREDQIDEARQEFAAFVAEPGADRYVDAMHEARRLRKAARRVEHSHEQQSYDVRWVWESRDFRRCPLAWILIGISVVVTLVAQFGREPRITRSLLVASYRSLPVDEVSVEELPQGRVFGGKWIQSNLWADLKRGEVWRLITPIFLHFDLLHLAFDMYWLFALGCEIEVRRKTWRFGLIVLTAALVTNLSQYFTTHWPLFGGMSGVDLALFGYVWMKGLYEPELGLGLGRQTVLFLMLYLMYTLAKDLPYAHAAHLSGLITGVLIGLGPHLWQSLRLPREE